MSEEDWLMILFLLIMLFIALGNVYLQRRMGPSEDERGG